MVHSSEALASPHVPGASPTASPDSMFPGNGPMVHAVSFPNAHGALPGPQGMEGNFSGAADFIREVFFPGEVPLGLVIDWSMALPVVAAVLPRSPASKRPVLCYGLVLLAVNGQRVAVGQRREEVEDLLAQRPLELAFEAPALDLVGDVATAAWRQRGPRPMHPAQDVQATPPSKTAVATEQSFFKLHPERTPLSRWGNLDVSVAAFSPWAERSRSHVTSVSPLPALESAPLKVMRKDSLGATSFSQIRHPPSKPALQTSGKWNARYATAGSALRGRPSAFVGEAGDVWCEPANEVGGFTRTASLPSLTAGVCRKAKAGSPRTALQLAADALLPDACYEELAYEVAPRGPGPPGRWPLGHEDQYACCLEDMVLAHHLHGAYEVGFRGLKRDPPRELELRFPELAASPRPKQVTVVEEVSCDVCGVILATKGALHLGQASSCFYYCRRCKMSGRRFELCLPCHANAVLQAEGKHCRPALHPHYLHCEHRSLAKYKDLRAAYSGPLHLKHAYCDHCGSRIDKVRTEVYVCLQCPEVHGLRFELCAACAYTLLERGTGIQRLRHS